MNAAERATNPEVATKIAAMVNLFKQYFPDLKENLKPWNNDPDTRQLVDPDSIDIGLNLPAGHTLLQLRFQEERLIGIEAICFGPFGNERWKLSTVGKWNYTGPSPPPPGFRAKLKQACQEVFVLFNGP